MEKKRKLPARAAARVEQIAKRRNITPPQPRRSETLEPAPAPAVAPEPQAEEPPPPLPKSIAAGKPLPTVETAQPDDLSNKDYQSVQESAVLAESLTRSRQKWITEGIFEKYWAKPTKKKGVVIEDANNPPKDSMMKLGQVTITVEPHVFEATMYAVKDPKPPPPPPPTGVRPILQYGPPNGAMPPPPTPKSAQTTKVPTPASAPSQPQTPAPVKAELPPAVQTPIYSATQTPTKPTVQSQLAQQTQSQNSNTPLTQNSSKTTPTLGPTAPRPPAASPRGMESVLAPGSVTQRSPNPTSNMGPQQTRPPPSPGLPIGTNTATSGGTRDVLPMGPASRPAGGAPLNNPAATKPSAAGATPAAKVPGADPIILTLAEKAGEDPELRDLMKRVAQGDATKPELERFQAIIDAITAESKRKGASVGPSADRLLVDGRTVRYFADEVRAILDIVLSSNPKQTSADLRPPAGSDPLVVMLVKTALDEVKTRDMVRRIAEENPRFSDATDLKVILDKLRGKLAKEMEQRLQTTQLPVAATAKSNGAAAVGSANGAVSSSSTSTPQSATATPQPPPAQGQQALRSKGPPPPPKPDISAIVFEFAGGTGDRYLFPKFSVLESLPVPAPQQQMLASFLIVRKGSKSEYPVADPELDYYQPVTIRLFTSTGRHLENLARVVAPEEEVRRYMDDVMDKMTRAEYILLAMRLPRRDKDGETGGGGTEEKDGANGNGGAKQQQQIAEVAAEQLQQPVVALAPSQPTPPSGVMWAMSRPPKPEIRELPPRQKMYSKVMDVDEQYQSFISSVSRKEAKET
ncbi:hypothetical protein B0H66DRAFT_578301 [Apodospora peruviana]|uniref:SWR1-complex protein 3 domain-containing protein n=1 Tax=Apodospora peruviana TaxID=516989 RepID=A0AAE0LZ94_9PEZI|nr:hypothetical protein B0H66DRAFT_578301 [Apodospora peruviana]